MSDDVRARLDESLKAAAARAYDAAAGALIEDSLEVQAQRFRLHVSPRVVVSVAVALTIGLGLVWLLAGGQRGGGLAPLVAADGGGPASASAMSGGQWPSQAPLTVHVAGAVNRPGVYDLPAGSRVADAVEAAGGATDNATTEDINLARALVDGEQVRVPTEGEQMDAHGGPAGAGDRININQADASALEDLPGVGPVLAKRIVAYRDEHGPFASVDELDGVTGVGPAILEGLIDAATV